MKYWKNRRKYFVDEQDKRTQMLTQHFGDSKTVSMESVLLCISRHLIITKRTKVAILIWWRPCIRNFSIRTTCTRISSIFTVSVLSTLLTSTFCHVVSSFTKFWNYAFLVTLDIIPNSKILKVASSKCHLAMFNQKMLIANNQTSDINQSRSR